MPARGFRQGWILEPGKRRAPSVLSFLRFWSARSAVGQGIAACFLEKPHEKSDGQSSGREGNNDACNDQRLRNRVAGESCRRPAAGHDAEKQKDPAAQDIESQNLPKWLGLDDQAKQTETHEKSCANPEYRGRAHEDWRGGPATSNASVAPIERIIASSMRTMTGLANPSG